MPTRITPIILWRGEVDNHPGALARILEPLASVRADLKVVMGYPLPGDPARAAIEIYPVSGTRVTSAARAVGLSEAGISALLIDGDNRAGLGHAIASRLAAAGINIEFLVGQVSGARHSTVIGFENPNDAAIAASLIKQAAATVRRPAARKTTAKGPSRGRRRTRTRARPSRR
jgi:hypothetical protein